MSKKDRRHLSNLQDLNEEKDWFTWSAPLRPFKRQDNNFWITILAILGLVAVIFFFARDFLVIIPAASALFLYYVMSTVPPEILENRLTNRGVHFGQVFYPWDAINYFAFGKTMDSQTLLLGVDINFFTKQVALIINPSDKNLLKDLCVKKIPLIETPPTFTDKLNQRLVSLLPFEDKKDPKSPQNP